MGKDFWQRITKIFTTYRFPILLTLVLRVCLSLWMMILWYILEPLTTRIPNYYNETYHALTPHSTWLGRALVDVWLRWDAVHYMNIAVEGYSGVGMGDWNFPPLYSYLTLLLKNLLAINETIAGLIISTVSTMFALIFFYRLVWKEFNDAELARSTVLLFGIYPASIFLFAPFTEALFFLLAFASLLAIQSKRWILAGLLISAATLARFQAIMLILPILLAVFQDFGKRQKIDVTKIIGAALSVLGLMGIFIWRYLQSAPNLFQGYAQFSNSVFVNPISGYYLALRQALLTSDWLSWTEIVSVTVFAVILVWMCFQKKYQPQAGWLIYSLATLAIFMSKNNEATAYQSANRYVLCLFPVFIASADWWNRARPWLKRLTINLSLTGLLIVAVLYILWIFIG